MQPSVHQQNPSHNPRLALHGYGAIGGAIRPTHSSSTSTIISASAYGLPSCHLLIGFCYGRVVCATIGIKLHSYVFSPAVTTAYRPRNMCKICCSGQAASALLLHLSLYKFFFHAVGGGFARGLFFSHCQFSGSSGCSLIKPYPATTTITSLPLPPSPTSSPMTNFFPTSYRRATCPNPYDCSCDVCFGIHCPDCSANFRNESDFDLVSPPSSCI